MSAFASSRLTCQICVWVSMSLIGRHAREANPVVHLPICFAGRIVAHAHHRPISMFLPKLRSRGIHVFGKHRRLSVKAMAGGAIDRDKSARRQRDSLRSPQSGGEAGFSRSMRALSGTCVICRSNGNGGSATATGGCPKRNHRQQQQRRQYQAQNDAQQDANHLSMCLRTFSFVICSHGADHFSYLRNNNRAYPDGIWNYCAHRFPSTAAVDSTAIQNERTGVRTWSTTLR